MAMISCPNCGKQISDRAKTCPGCGYVLQTKEAIKEQPEKMVCEECGSEITPEMEVCPNCGCPIEKGETESAEKVSPDVQAVEVRKINIQVDESGKKKAKKFGVLAILAVVAVVVAFFGYRAYQNQKLEEVKQQYQSDLERAASSILTGASMAETAGGLIHDVWYDTIYEKDRESTRKYTKRNTYSFHDDFNTSLSLLMLDYDFSKSLDEIKENQNSVRQDMKDLKNPPEGYEDAYDDLKTLYDWYTKMTELAINPSGNLNSYTSSYNEADQGFANAYKTMQMHFD